MTAAALNWTITDEAPALATWALLPVLKKYLEGTGVGIETRDISLAGRIVANFPEKLTPEQRVPDDLALLGALARTPAANIIKLPNISATIPQLQTAIKELQAKGYEIPGYPENASTDAERALQARFAVVLGSAVNPVLREGNSDRRPAASVKAFARRNPHRMMKPWPRSGSKTRVAHMTHGDFYGSERSLTLDRACDARIEFTGTGAKAVILRDSLPLEAGEVLDTAVMSISALREFYAATMATAQAQGTLLSLHLKATMMKVSDPILFGHCVSVYYGAALDKHAAALNEIGANVNHGLADVLAKLDRLPPQEKAEIEADIEAVYAVRPALAMVDSRRGITNLHVPNTVIIDASMPNVVRDGGRMWNRNDELQDTVAMIPDRCYATVYQAIIEDCQRHGQFDPATMGSVANVGLMAKKAEEDGSHDKTFEAPGQGTIRIVDRAGRVLLEQAVETGDIFRACQTKDAAVRDWVKLAVRRARESRTPAIFWLDPARGHDAQIIAKVQEYLSEHDTRACDIRILAPVQAMSVTVERLRNGQDTISVTGNVLRDYLTDLFPILELGTSARMLSIVPLLNGGGLFETGAGGSAPKHVQQFVREGHLRWDSLGEYCAVVPALELAAEQTGSRKLIVLAAALDQAIGTYLEAGRIPSRQVGELDNRGSTFYLALYWSRALAAQTQDADLRARFRPVASALTAAEETIGADLLAAQGHPVDLGGYYLPDARKAEAAMRPSPTLNRIIAGIGQDAAAAGA